MMKKRLVFELTNIKKRYHNKTVLNIKHFQCHPGTIYGIIGPIGAGKTTLLKILGGRIKPSEGELRFEGDKFQTNWFGKIKPADDIWFGSIEDLDRNKTVSDLLPISTGSSKKNNDSYFSAKTQNNLISEKIKNLSQGEKAWILKCMLHNQDPRVVIIDDYCAYLDKKRQLEFQKIIQRMNKNLGTTIVLGSHDDRLIKKFASVLIYFDNGHISKIRPGISSKNSRRK
jgi:ABC-type multidrug transport system ATPase subunit